jgi:hypothetical protein
VLYSSIDFTISFISLSELEEASTNACEQPEISEQIETRTSHDDPPWTVYSMSDASHNAEEELIRMDTEQNTTSSEIGATCGDDDA